jgi:hypothetical protein
MPGCPACGASISLPRVLALSDDLRCPVCGRPLELAPAGPLVASFAGLAAAALAAWVAARGPARPGDSLFWFLPVVYGILAFGIVSPLILLFAARLRPAPEKAAPRIAAEPNPSSGHAPAHH